MIFYFFVDGIGFGKNDTDTNPFARYSQGIFAPLAGQPLGEGRLRVLETDASLGLPGLPQSATGQTSLWTGINGVKAVGRHINGFPTFTLKKIIVKHSILRVLNDFGIEADLLNCYTPAFFQKFGKNPRFLSASTLIQMASGRPLKNLDDLREGRGLYMDIDHEYLITLSKDLIPANDPVMQRCDPYTLGRSVPRQFQNYGLAIFEYFITDKVGHDQNWEVAKKTIKDLEDFLTGFLDGMDPHVDTLILTSDHGNMEDLSTSTHTTNPVPTYIAGKMADSIESKVHKLTDIPIAIYDSLGLQQAIESLERSEFYI
jgi:hypothetical protein